MADPRQEQELQLGNYRLVKLLGKGGFALVFLGEHIFLERKAAIKVLRDSRMLTSSDLDSFLIEARTIGSLDHPHIVRVMDFGVDGKSNMPFLVMDFAPNGPLSRRHPKGSILPLPMIVEYVKQVAAALQYAHDKNVVHCDVKPENMLLGQDNRVMLGDFGIAVIAQGTMSTRDVVGTIYYMAPEQFLGKPRPASDQYALGVVVYEWLCGRLPFTGKNPLELGRLHIEVSPPSLRRIVPAIPHEVEQVVLTALAKDPQQRFRSVQAFATALAAAIQLPPPTPRIDVPPPPPLPHAAPTEPASMPMSGRLPSIRELLPNASASAPLAPKPAPLILRLPTEPLDKPNSPPPVEEHRVVSNLPPPPIPRALGVPLDDPVAHPPLDKSVDVLDLFPPPAPQVPAKLLPTVLPGTQMYKGHSGWVSALAWSPGGRQIASGSWDNTIQVWDAATEHTLFTYTGHTHTVKAVAWSPDGIYIASGSWDNTVQMWRAATGDELPSYTEHKAQVETVAWSPDGVYIASAGHDGQVQVWRAANRRTVFTYRGHTEPVWSVAWSPDGRHIASASYDGTVQVWDAITGDNSFLYQGHSGQISTVAWSPDGQRLASADSDGIVQVWQATTGKVLCSYKDNTGAVKALGWSPDGRYIAFAVKIAQVWDTGVPVTSTPIFTYHGHDSWINALAWSPNGRFIASASDDQTVQVWHPL